MKDSFVTASRRRLNQRFQQWADQRTPRATRIQLNQRRIYIVPTGSGFFWLSMVLVIFLVAVNYRNSLAYGLCFFMLSLFLLAIIHTWRNLAGITLVAKRAEAGFAGERIQVSIECLSERRPRYAIAVGWPDTEYAVVSFDSDREQGLLAHAGLRGWFRPGRLRIESIYPLGLCRAWSWVRLDFHSLVYPAPDDRYPLPENETIDDGERSLSASGVDDFAGFRSHQETDTPAHVFWKGYARTGELLTKQFDQPSGRELRFSLDHTLMWRALIWFGRGTWPSGLLRRLLVALSLVLIITSSGWQFSLELAVTFLVTGYALKMLEMKTRRDALVIAYIGFFVVGAGVIYSQSLMQALYQLLCLGVLIAAIHAMYSPTSSASASFSIKGSLRFTGLILLQALPLTLALFIFVPRIGPLWAVPWPEGEAKTGLSDTMQPGDVARLSQSYELAFRAQFTGSVPPARERYWRTLVLDQYDGERWLQSDLIRLLNQFPGEIDDERDWQSRSPVIYGWWQVQPGQYNYEVLLEPNGRQWLPVLGMAAASVAETTVLRTLRLEADKPIFERRLYQPAQQSVFAQTIAMPSWLLALNKSLPVNGNVQSRILAQQLFA